MFLTLGFLSSSCFACSRSRETETWRLEAKSRNLGIFMLAPLSTANTHLFPLALQIYTVGEQ